jgi:predicted metal-dependent hydrolase
MLILNDDLEGALREYIALLKREEYFEAHEVLEEAWHSLRLKKHSLASFVRGYINAAIAFEHLKRDRKNAEKKALKTLSAYERHKDKCVEGIECYLLFKEAKQKIEEIKIFYHDVLISV